MLTDKQPFSHLACTSMALLLVAVLAMQLFQANDTYYVTMALLASGLVVMHPLPYRQWTMIDICLCLITVYDFISCFYASCPVPAIHSAFFSLFCLTTYFVARKLFFSATTTRIITIGSYLPIGIALLLAVCSFFIFRQSVLSAGFIDTYHFRFLFHPLAYITNVWAEILLILLGWICIIRRYSNFLIFLTILAILFSFSRGAYIALGIYVVTWLFFVKPIQEKLRLLAISLVVITLTAIFFSSEIKTTLQMNRTVSQQLSTEGRITSSQAAWDTFREHPWGYGNGCYTFAIDQTLNQDSTSPYALYAPNLIIQLLIEKGIIGIFIYLLLAINICRMIQKRRNYRENNIIALTLLALIVKEMAQATLFYTPFALFMFYMLLAYLQKQEIPAEIIKNPRSATGYVFPSFVLVGFVCWNIFNYLKIKDDSYTQRCETAWKKGEYTEAIRLIKQTGEETPNLINKGLLYIRYYKKTENYKYLQAAVQVLNEAHLRQPKDLQIRYLQAQTYLYGKKATEAFPILEKLATDHPKNSLYLVTLSDAIYQQGKKEAALEPLVNAIRYTPRLLTGQRIRDLKQTDSVFYHNLLQKLSVLQPTSEDDPASYARYGYIARWCGNQSLSNEYLRKAINDLPNLATPWHLLGDDNKYRLLIYGAFRKDLLSAELPEEKEMTDERLFEMSYQAKFMNWYGSELMTFEK